jgi:hypothetical protein
VNALFYVLGGSASIVSIFVVVQLITLCGISKETGLRYEGKRLFHGVLFGSLIGRAFFCFVYPSIGLLPSYPWIFLFVWTNHSLEMVFFFAFFLLVTFWSDLITSLRGPGSCATAGCLRGGLIGFTAFVAAIVASFLGLMLGRPEQVLLLDAIYAGIVNLLSIAVAFLFLVLGVVLFRLLRRTDQLLTVAVEKKKSMAKTVFFVTALCTLCFAFRVGVSIYSIGRWKKRDAFFHVEICFVSKRVERIWDVQF